MFLSVFIACGAWAFNIPASDFSITGETVTSPGLALVTVFTKPSDARFSIDKGPLSSSGWKGSLVPGTHSISVTAADHYPSQFSFSVLANTKYSITVTLEPHTGFLAMTISPTDAGVYVEGTKVEGPIVELPVGRYSVLVRKFGYNEAKVPISILWQRTSTLNIALSTSVFEISDYHVSPQSFNPANKGTYNRAALSFSVTAPGLGQVEIINAAGTVVRTDELPVFRTWAQRFVWRGEDGEGKALPDGEYEIKVTVWPFSFEGEPHPESALSISEKVTLDSSKIIMASGVSSARPGLLYFADPKVRELLPGSAELVGGFPGSVSFALGFKVGEATMLSAEGLWDIHFGGGVAGSVLRNVASFSGIDLALLGRVAWTAADTSDYPGSASEAEISIPIAFDAGSLRMGLSPGFVYDIGKEEAAGRLGLGLWYESQSLNAGISAQQDIGSAGIMNASQPLFFAAEARTLFEKSPFTLLLRISGALKPSLADMAASIGFGVAW